ncbi:sodium:solute symporter [candidate division KSB1 bacterium]
MAYLIGVFVYLAILLAVGWWSSRKVQTGDDFLVAGRGLGLPVMVGTLLATWIGSGSIIAGAGLAYRKGFSALWFDVGVWAGILLLAFIAPRVRRFAGYTVADILEARFGPASRIMGSLVVIVAYTAIASYQFKAGGMVLNVVTGISAETGMIITAAVAILYTVLAGLISVSYTDLVNGIVIIFAILFATPLLFVSVGGTAGLRASVPPEHFQVFGTMSPLEAFGYTIPTLLLLLGESNMYQRFYAARDVRTARRAVWWWVGGTVVVETAIVLLAVLARAGFPEINPETAILQAARYGLPTAAGILLLAAVVAIIISTADSFLLAPATSIMHDFYRRFINPDASDRTLLVGSRVVVVLLGLLAFIQGRFFETVLAMAIYAYTVYGCGLTPTLMAAFFWRRATGVGAVSAIFTGLVVTIVWEASGKPLGLPTVYPALMLSVAALVLGSFLGGREEVRGSIGEEIVFGRSEGR